METGAVVAVVSLVNQRVTPQALGRQAETETSELRFYRSRSGSVCARGAAMPNELPPYRACHPSV